MSNRRWLPLLLAIGILALLAGFVVDSQIKPASEADVATAQTVGPSTVSANSATEPSVLASGVRSPSAATANDDQNNPLLNRKGFYHPYIWTMQQNVADLEKLERKADANTLRRVSNFHTSTWVTGTEHDMKNINMVLYGGGKEKGATKTGQIPTLVLYNLPKRDCGYYIKGGLSPSGYRAWINQISGIIKKTKVAIILEPDSTHVTDCLSEAQKKERWSLMRHAAQTFKNNNPNASTYIAAVAGKWAIDTVSPNLLAAGVSLTRGIAINVSGFQTTKDSIEIGEMYRKKLKLNIYYVIDTSRNGNGPNQNMTHPEQGWCNPPGRKFGSPSTTNTGHSRVDAFLWIKGASSDGPCWHSQHFANAWEYPLQLARNTWG